MIQRNFGTLPEHATHCTRSRTPCKGHPRGLCRKGAFNFCGDFYVPSSTGGLASAALVFVFSFHRAVYHVPRQKASGKSLTFVKTGLVYGIMNPLFDRSKNRKIMGHVYADIILSNAIDVGMAQRGHLPMENVRKTEVNAMVDSGAMTLTINEKIAKQLGLEVQKRVDVTLADGSFRKCDYVGPVNIDFENRSACCRALVLPGADEILLGVIPLEEMDVIIDPIDQKLKVHPDRPLLAGMKVK